MRKPVTIDGEYGAVWLWVTDGNEHAGINLSAQITDPAVALNRASRPWGTQVVGLSSSGAPATDAPSNCWVLVE